MAIIVISINLLGLIWCYTQQSDKVTDITYSLSFFILVTILWSMHADSPLMCVVAQGILDGLLTRVVP